MGPKENRIFSGCIMEMPIDQIEQPSSFLLKHDFENISDKISIILAQKNQSEKESTVRALPVLATLYLIHNTIKSIHPHHQRIKALRSIQVEFFAESVASLLHSII